MNGDFTTSNGVVERRTPDGQVEVLLDGEVRVCHAGPALKRSGLVIREGDRVTVRTEADGEFRGEITRVWAPAEETEVRVPRGSLIMRRSGTALKPEDQRLSRSARPGWPTGAECAPQAGDEVHCIAGAGTVTRVMGKTGNGSRLLELQLADRPRSAFFAAASNVLVAPRAAVATAELAAGGLAGRGEPVSS